MNGHEERKALQDEESIHCAANPGTLTGAPGDTISHPQMRTFRKPYNPKSWPEWGALQCCWWECRSVNHAGKTGINLVNMKMHVSYMFKVACGNSIYN